MLVCLIKVQIPKIKMIKKNPWFDKWAKKAKEKGYPARSVFKLMEIQNRFRLIKKGNVVLDLGASPGSWSKYACEIVGPTGKVIGIDIQPIKINLPNFYFIQKDVYQITSKDFYDLGIEKFDVILSDMAPNTTGDAFGDHICSVRLVEKAFELAKEFLKEKGHFIAKIFEGAKTSEIKKKFEKSFGGVKLFKPKSSRKQSKEIFIIALNFKPF